MTICLTSKIELDRNGLHTSYIGPVFITNVRNVFLFKANNMHNMTQISGYGINYNNLHILNKGGHEHLFELSINR